MVENGEIYPKRSVFSWLERIVPHRRPVERRKRARGTYGLIGPCVLQRPSDGHQTPWSGAGRLDVSQSPVSASLGTTICPGGRSVQLRPSKPSASLVATEAPRLRAMAVMRQPASARLIRQTGDVAAVEPGMGYPLRSGVACRVPPHHKQEPLSNDFTQSVRRYYMVFRILA